MSHPLLLRLHHVRQNGGAFLTYPSMRVHRFEHSVGAMHIAGHLFLFGTRFSPDAELHDAYKSILAKIFPDLSIDDLRTAILKADNQQRETGLSRLQTDGLYRLHDLIDIDDDAIFAELLFFQAVRLATLMHDIGHPPFSHTFETALKQLEKDRYRDHETVGIDLLNYLSHDLKNYTDEVIYYLGRTVISIAKVIFDGEHELHKYVQGLSDIVSSDIDADRLDYVRRDASAAGLTTNAYDLGRLYDAVKLISNPSGAVELQWTAAALSTIEAFFSVRFHLYRWALWHHHVVRQNMALILVTRLLWSLLRKNNETLGPLHLDLIELVRISRNPSRIGDYWYFTDYYLLDNYAKILSALDKDEMKWIGKDENWGELADLYKFLRTFLYREKKWLSPFWKRPDDYVIFSNQVIEQESDDSAVQFNDMLGKAYQRLVAEDANEAEGSPEAAAHGDKYDDYLSFRFCERLEHAINASLKPHGCRCRAYYLAKFKPAPTKLQLLGRDDEPMALGTLSPSVAALSEAWRALPHLWLFLEYKAFGDNGETLNPDVVRQRVKPVGVYSVVAESLRNCLLNG